MIVDVFIFNFNPLFFFLFFFFNDTATTEIYTLSLHDALPISHCSAAQAPTAMRHQRSSPPNAGCGSDKKNCRSEEHTSELQSQSNLVCRLLLEKKKKKKTRMYTSYTKKREHTHIVSYPRL